MGDSISKTTFFVGTGASLAWPSGLPLFGAIRESILDDLAIDDEPVDGRPSARTEATKLAPEVFMSCAAAGGFDIGGWLTQVLSQGEPNVNHFVLAEALRQGATVWTVNLDDHIEDACEATGVEVETTVLRQDAAPSPTARLLKPHGSVRTGEFLVESDDVVRRLGPEWAGRLTADVKDRHVVAFGYQGADLDFRLVLADALGDASSIVWFETEARHEILRARFPATTGSSSRLLGEHPAGLTDLFVSWARDAGLTDTLPDGVEADAASTQRQPIAHVAGNRHLSAAALYDLAGDRDHPRHEYVQAMRTTHLGVAARSARKVFQIDAYARRRWTKPIMGLAAGPARAALPRGLRTQLDRVEVTLLSSHLGDHAAALDRVGRCADPDDVAIVLALAKAERIEGKLDEALQHARTAYDSARDARQVNEAAHAVFEIAYSTMWQGDLDGAAAALGEFFDGLDALASIRWVGWALFLQACIAIYKDDPDAGLRYLAPAAESFDADHLPSAVVSCDTVKLTAARLAGDDRLFEQTAHRLEDWQAVPGTTAFTGAAIDIELAEHHRTHSRPDQARAIYDRLRADQTASPYHRCLALAGAAELDRQEGTDTAATDEGLVACRDHDFRIVETGLLITKVLAGRLDLAAATAAMRCPPLTRKGTSGDDVHDFCLGPHRPAHELFFP